MAKQERYSFVPKEERLQSLQRDMEHYLFGGFHDEKGQIEHLKEQLTYMLDMPMRMGEQEQNRSREETVRDHILDRHFGKNEETLVKEAVSIGRTGSSFANRISLDSLISDMAKKIRESLPSIAENVYKNVEASEIISTQDKKVGFAIDNKMNYCSSNSIKFTFAINPDFATMVYELKEGLYDNNFMKNPPSWIFRPTNCFVSLDEHSVFKSIKSREEILNSYELTEKHYESFLEKRSKRDQKRTEEQEKWDAKKRIIKQVAKSECRDYYNFHPALKARRAAEIAKSKLAKGVNPQEPAKPGRTGKSKDIEKEVRQKTIQNVEESKASIKDRTVIAVPVRGLDGRVYSAALRAEGFHVIDLDARTDWHISYLSDKDQKNISEAARSGNKVTLIGMRGKGLPGVGEYIRYDGNLYTQLSAIEGLTGRSSTQMEEAAVLMESVKGDMGITRDVLDRMEEVLRDNFAMNQGMAAMGVDMILNEYMPKEYSEYKELGAGGGEKGNLSIHEEYEEHTITHGVMDNEMEL